MWRAGDANGENDALAGVAGECRIGRSAQYDPAQATRLNRHKPVTGQQLDARRSDVAGRDAIGGVSQPVDGAMSERLEEPSSRSRRKSIRSKGRMPTESYVVYLRRIWTHQYIEEPVSWPRLLALMWLIQYAHFSDGVKRYRGHEINVPAGHFIASVRRLGKQFRWSNPKVLRFLDELVRDETLCTVSVTPAGTLYRFVNWGLHQPRTSAAVTADVHSHVNSDVNSDRTRRSNGKKRLRKEKTSSASRETWLTPFFEVWERKYGTMPLAGKLAGALQPVVKKLGAEETLVRWQRYVQRTNLETVNVWHFAEKHSLYAGAFSANREHSTARADAPRINSDPALAGVFSGNSQPGSP